MAARTLTVAVAYDDSVHSPNFYTPVAGAISLTPSEAATLRAIASGQVTAGGTITDPLQDPIRKLIQLVAAQA